MSPFCIRRLWMLALLLAACAVCVPAAQAATTCSATATNVAFGTVSTSGTTDASATFDVTCTTTGLALLANTKVRMCLNIGEGSNGGGNFNPRRMLNGSGDSLQFQLYTDAARSQIWGARGNPTIPNPLLSDFDYPVPVLGGNQTKMITIYGRVPTQTLVAGSYTNSFSGIHTSIDYRYDTQLGTVTYPASCISGGSGGNSFSGAFPFTASATVPSDCWVYTTTDLDFGSVAGLLTSNIDQTSTISITCTGRTAWNIGLNNGLHASGNIRRMQFGVVIGNYVNYELYRDSPRTSRWGNILDTDTVPGTGTGTVQTLTVYGRVPAQTPAAGSYSDTITVTITY
ncbi:MAG TPA: spore coat protein U domain-containing protein [Luteimonas sp.]|nr:spore coat protein U domain-containing protein [Luteimonas sp.]